MKVKHKTRMNQTEVSMIRWMCGIKQNVRKRRATLLGLEPVSLMIKKNRLSWFGYVESKCDTN